MRISDWSSDVCSSDLHTHPERHWTTASMAESAGMSRSLFCKSFREAVGATPIHYLKTVRLELAASLLRQTGLPLSEVAHRVGYKSDEAFLRAFPSGYGVTPGRFRSATSSSPGFDTAEPCMTGRPPHFADR